MYKKAYDIWFEINNLGYFVELLIPDNRSKVANLEMNVWDHELYSFLIEMGKINAYFQKLRLKKMQNKGSYKKGKNKSGKGAKDDDDLSDLDEDADDDEDD